MWIVVTRRVLSIMTGKELMSKKDVVPNVGQKTQGWMVVGEALQERWSAKAEPQRRSLPCKAYGR
jgi:hypothetical protein